MSREKKAKISRKEVFMGHKQIDLGLANEEERKIIEARRAYKREWNAANKERVAEYNRRFWAKRAAKQSKLNDEQRADTSAK